VKSEKKNEKIAKPEGIDGKEELAKIGPGAQTASLAAAPRPGPAEGDYFGPGNEMFDTKADFTKKFNDKDKNFKVNDKLTKSKTAADWRIGKIDAPPRTGRDIIMSKGETLTESSNRAVLSGPEVVTEEPKSQTEPVQGELFLTKVVAGADIQTLQCTNLPDRGNLRISLRFSYGNIYLAKRGEESRGEENEDKILNTDHLYKAVLMV
jgi:hypothetical protein